MTTATRAIAALAAVVLTVTGCSGDDGQDTEPSASSTASTTLPAVAASTPPAATPTMGAAEAVDADAAAFAAWAGSEIAADPDAWCEPTLRDARGDDLSETWKIEGGLYPNPETVTAAFDAGCAEWVEPAPADDESPADRVVASMRHNLRMMADGGYCDTYPASGKANTVAGLEMIYPDAFEVLSGDEVWSMLEDICA